MTAQEVLSHFQQVGQWVNWERTCDQILHGDPNAEVKRIAVAWIASNECLRKAADKGHSLFITHEPIFYHGYRGTSSRETLVAEKRNLLDELGMTVLRCHDTWDRMPEVGIPDAWASFLGFETEERPVESYYKISLLGDITVEETARRIAEKVRLLGQETVLIFGDRAKRVNRMAVGTGAITHLPSMHDLGADVILATDDGFNFWDGGLWARDLDVPLLMVNHSTAEKPGMQAMAEYLKKQFPGTSVEYLDVEFPYSVL